MARRFKYFLLIDDNKIINFLNKSTLEKMVLADEIVVAENGAEALEIIEKKGLPELMFLDINMPIMNGWEFLANYIKIDTEMEKSVIVLTTGISLDSQEEKIAKTIYKITNFHNKTLSQKIVTNIVDNNFGDARQLEYIYTNI